MLYPNKKHIKLVILCMKMFKFFGFKMKEYSEINEAGGVLLLENIDLRLHFTHAYVHRGVICNSEK
jgi:hypothetical protein